MNNPAQFPVDVVRHAQDAPASKSLAYADYKKTLRQLIDDFDANELRKCEKRREFRRHHVNVAQERTSKAILPDETKVPDRTIETNIRRDKTNLVQLLVQPTTVLSFTDPMRPAVNFSPLANFHTDQIRTPGWQKEWLYLIDAIEMHGAGYLEVFFNPASPTRTSIEYVRRDHLIFPEATRSLDSCGQILRRYEITKSEFSAFAKKYGFNPTQAKLIEDYYKERTESVKLHRILLKVEDIVNVAWMADGKVADDDWLKAPEPYDIGLRQPIASPIPGGPPAFGPTQLTSYPIFVFPLDLEEDEVILRTQGRVSLDLHIQEALTAVISATVNGAVRAAGLYPTRKKSLDDPPTNQEDFTLAHGRILEGEFNFGKLEWPSALAISLAQFLRTHNAAQSGNIDWAAMNRADTAKTATELNLARQEADQLKSMSTTLFMLCALLVELLRWQVWLSQVRAGLAPMPACQGKPDPTGVIGPDQIDIFSPTLIPTLSADQQVVRRAEQMSRYMQYWNFVQGSPYQFPMLESMLQDAFPDQFQKWKVAVQQQMAQQNGLQTANQLLMHAFQVLRSMKLEAVPEPDRQPFADFLNSLGAYLQQQQPPAANGQATTPG